MRHDDAHLRMELAHEVEQYYMAIAIFSGTTQRAHYERVGHRVATWIEREASAELLALRTGNGARDLTRLAASCDPRIGDLVKGRGATYEASL